MIRYVALTAGRCIFLKESGPRTDCVASKVAETISFTVLLEPYMPKTLVFIPFERHGQIDHKRPGHQIWVVASSLLVEGI